MTKQQALTALERITVENNDLRAKLEMAQLALAEALRLREVVAARATRLQTERREMAELDAQMISRRQGGSHGSR